MARAGIKKRGRSAGELLKLIFQYIDKIANERDVEKALILLADMGRDLVSADRCTVWLVNRKTNKLWSKVAHGMDRIEIPLGMGIAGHTADQGTPVIINDAYSDPRFDKAVDKKTGYQTRNILALPIHNSSGEVMGVFQAINKMTGELIFSSIDMEHLLLAASYTGKQLEALALQEEIEATQREIILTLSETGELRSKETGNHVKRVAEYSRVLAAKCGMEDRELEMFRNASPMHDIGKIAIPDAVLLKPGKLDDEEYEIMKSHTTLGHEMLKHSDRQLIKTAAIVALEHHERWDGKGYPRGIGGDEIHLYGRITAIADVFDALSCKRIYKDPWPLEKIYSLFAEERGRQFDPGLVDHFLQTRDAFAEITERLKD